MADKPTITLHCGDCLEYMKSMPDKSVDLVFADPPFNVGKDYESFRVDYAEWCGVWIAECFRILKDTGAFYLMTIPRHLAFSFSIMDKLGIFVNQIVWKHQAGANDGRRFWGLYQPILIYAKSDSYLFERYAERKPLTNNNRWGKNSTGYKGQIGDLWDDIPFVFSGSSAHPEAIRKEGGFKKVHPCQMPKGLPGRAIRFSTNNNAAIFDPFMGSGTTGVACKLLRRNFIGCEIDERYFRLAQNRINNTEWGMF